MKHANVASRMEDLPFARGFARLCDDGWVQGWHERNGGNLSYRLTDEDIAAARPLFAVDDAPWTDLGIEAPNLAGTCLMVTGAGRYMRNVREDLAGNAAIVELDAAGKSYRVVWGLAHGGTPTSELASHVLIHSVRLEATGGKSRVLYHAHPENVIALTKVMPLDARTFTRALWKAMTECIIVFPQGVGVVDWMVPGGAEIARATAELMKTFDAAIWAQHGLFASGPDFDTTFGLMHTIEKSARIYVAARLLNGGSDDFPQTITDADLRAIVQAYHLEANEAFLD